MADKEPEIDFGTVVLITALFFLLVKAIIGE